jgi:hypothetical protein
MALLAQEVDEDVLAAAEVVDPGGDLPQAPLRPDVVEEHRAQARELLDEMIHGLDAAVEQRRDVPREQVVVPDVDAAHGQVDDERRQQAGRALRVELDQFQPSANVLQVGAVDLDAPLVVHPLDHGRLETEVDQGVDKKVDEVEVVRALDALPRVEDAAQGGCGVVLRALFEDGEGLADEALHVAVVTVDDDPGQRPVDLPQRVLVQQREAGNAHHLEEEDQFEVMPPAAGAAALEQFLRDGLVGRDDLVKPRQRQQPLGSRRRCGGRSREDRLQLDPPLGETGVGDVPEEVVPRAGLAELGRLAVEPRLRVGLGRPEGVGALQEAGDHSDDGIDALKAAGPRNHVPRQTRHGEEAADDELEGLRARLCQALEHDGDEGTEARDTGAGVRRDQGVQDLQQSVRRVRPRVGLARGVQGRQKNAGHGLRRLHSPGVPPEEVDVPQRVLAGLRDDEAPVAIRVGQLAQEGRDALGQAVVLAHHLQDDGVGRVDRHIHAGVGQVDFEGLGFGAGGRVHGACPKGFPPPASGEREVSEAAQPKRDSGRECPCRMTEG